MSVSSDFLFCSPNNTLVRLRQHMSAQSPPIKTLQAGHFQVPAAVVSPVSALTGVLAQDLQGASDAYSAVLALPAAASADKLAATSNRAACSLAQRNYSSTVSDCNAALGLLTGQDMHASSGVHAWLATEQGAWLFCSRLHHQLSTQVNLQLSKQEHLIPRLTCTRLF